jgi:kynureninase
VITRDDALDRDWADSLAGWRDEFVIPDPRLVYLDGNSLGRTPKRTVDALVRVVEDQWAGDLITSWWENDWLDLPLTVGDTLAPVIGALAGEVAVHDSTTVCLFQLVNVALDLSNGSDLVIAVADTEFPTDRYVVDGIARLRHGINVRRGLDDLDGVDVVVRSHVDYRTAEISPIAAETERARRAGAITVWDLSHSAGVVDVDLQSAGVDLAAGCTYKFLNGGPGAPAFTYVRSSIVEHVTQPIWGWFGQRDQFAMDNPFEARDGIGRVLNGTPGILGLTAARCGIELTAEAGIDRIAAKAVELATFAIGVADEFGLTCPTARPPTSSGGHITITHPDADRLQRELVDRGVIVDKRDPDVLRFGLSPLTTRFIDVFNGLATLADVSVGR